MNKNKDLFDLLKSLEKRNLEINKLFWGSDFLDEEISMLWSILDTEYKISGMDTDESAELYFKFGNNEISKSKIMSDLKKLSK